MAVAGLSSSNTDASAGLSIWAANARATSSAPGSPSRARHDERTQQQLAGPPAGGDRFQLVNPPNSRADLMVDGHGAQRRQCVGLDPRVRVGKPPTQAWGVDQTLE